MPYSASSTAISARKKVPHETPNRRFARRGSLCRRPNPRRSLPRSGTTSPFFVGKRKKPYYTLSLAVLEPGRFAGHVISSRLYCNPKALWKLNWFLRDFGYDTEMLGRDEVDETQLVGLNGVVKASHIVSTALPCSGSTALHPLADGKNFHPQIWTVHRWLDDLQLYPDQPYLSCPRRYRHRYLDGWQEKDTRAAMLFGRPSNRPSPLCFRREDPAAVLFGQWGLCKDMGLTYSGNDTWDRMLQQGIQLLDRFAQDGPRSYSAPSFHPADSVQSDTRFWQQFRRLRRCHWRTGWHTVPSRMEDYFCTISGRTRRHFRTGSPTRLLFVDDGNRRSCPSCFRPQAAGRSSIPPRHDYRGTAPGVRNPGQGHSPTDRVGALSSAQRHPLPQNPCTTCPFLGLCLDKRDLVEAALVRKPGVDLGLFDELSFRPMPMPPKLNRKRALFVLTKIDEILAWETQKEAERDPGSSSSVGICARCGRDSTGGSRPGVV